MSDTMEQMPAWAKPLGQIHAKLKVVRAEMEKLEAEHSRLMIELHQAQATADEWVKRVIRTSAFEAEAAGHGTAQSAKVTAVAPSA